MRNKSQMVIPRQIMYLGTASKTGREAPPHSSSDERTRTGTLPEPNSGKPLDESTEIAVRKNRVSVRASSEASMLQIAEDKMTKGNPYPKTVGCPARKHKIKEKLTKLTIVEKQSSDAVLLETLGENKSVVSEKKETLSTRDGGSYSSNDCWSDSEALSPYRTNNELSSPAQVNIDKHHDTSGQLWKDTLLPYDDALLPYDFENLFSSCFNMPSSSYLESDGGTGLKHSIGGRVGGGDHDISNSNASVQVSDSTRKRKHHITHESFVKEVPEISVSSPTGETEGDEVETQSESHVSFSEWTQQVKTVEEPEAGMEFISEEKALGFYESYAKAVGFKVRKGKVQRFPNSLIKNRLLLCSREGFRCPKKHTDKKPKYSRKETRTGCPARLKITAQDDGVFVISDVCLEHNHELVGQQRNNMRSCTQAHSKEPNVESKNCLNVDCNNELHDVESIASVAENVSKKMETLTNDELTDKILESIGMDEGEEDEDDTQLEASVMKTLSVLSSEFGKEKIEINFEEINCIKKLLAEILSNNLAEMCQSTQKDAALEAIDTLIGSTSISSHTRLQLRQFSIDLRRLTESYTSESASLSDAHNFLSHYASRIEELKAHKSLKEVNTEIIFEVKEKDQTATEIAELRARLEVLEAKHASHGTTLSQLYRKKKSLLRSMKETVAEFVSRKEDAIVWKNVKTSAEIQLSNLSLEWKNIKNKFKPFVT